MTPPDPAARAALPGWMARQRWYTGKGHEPRLELVGRLALPAADDVTVESWLVRDVGAEPVLYQVPLAFRDAPLPGLADALVAGPAAGDGRWVYDGCHDPAGAAALLRAIVREEGLGDADPAVVTGARGHRAGALPELPTSGSHVLRGEQSNTSIIFDAAGQGAVMPVMLKVFRVLHPGLNPDVEVQQALASAGSDRVPRPVGDLLGRWPTAGAGTAEGHLALAQEFLPGVQDAWRVALAALTAGEDFGAPARALGRATAEVHATLAAVLPTRPADQGARDALLATWRRRYATAGRFVPELAGRAREVEEVLRAGGAAPWPDLQRIHGDYHLGQVIDAPGRGWVLLDFEGEPLRPLAERTLPDLPQRDVAGMLRSFDYAGASAGEPGAGGAWATRAREAFLDGYGEVTGTDPRADAALLRALELDKALYEAVYEARNRPDWLPIPLGGVARILQA